MSAIKNNINKIEAEILKAISTVLEKNDITYLEIDSALIRILKSNNEDLIKKQIKEENNDN